MRWLVDRWRRKKLSAHVLSEEDLAAHADRSPGVLMASGFIGGGAIAGIIIAIVTGFMSGVDKRITDWAAANNPLYAGPHADLLAIVPFAALAVFLYLVGREVVLRKP